MYIEVVHDDQGNILSCYCADSLPEKGGAPFFEHIFDELDGAGNQTGKKTKALPPGLEHVRLNIDTITAMEIEEASGQKAVINPATGLPEIVTIDRTQVIREMFTVDRGRNHAQGKTLRALPPGMAMRGLTRKA